MCIKLQVNRMNCVESRRGNVRLTIAPPPPSGLRVTIFSRRLLGLIVFIEAMGFYSRFRSTKNHRLIIFVANSFKHVRSISEQFFKGNSGNSACPRTNAFFDRVILESSLRLTPQYSAHHTIHKSQVTRLIAHSFLCIRRQHQ